MPVLTTRLMVAEKGIKPFPSVSESEALSLCNSAFERHGDEDLNPHSMLDRHVNYPLFYYPLIRKRRDSNPRVLSNKRFSRPPRYDHFGTLPFKMAEGLGYDPRSDISATQV